MNSTRVYFKFALIAVVVITTAFSYSLSLPNSVQKKVDKELANLWPESSIVLLEDEYSSERRKSALVIGITSIYKLYEEDELKGYMVYLKVPSKFDYFDLGIFYDLDLKIKSMKVLVYREDHGGEVGSRRWLKQFTGLGADDPMKLNEDIQGISGATISCEAATIGAREVSEFMNNRYKDL